MTLTERNVLKDLGKKFGIRYEFRDKGRQIMEQTATAPAIQKRIPLSKARVRQREDSQLENQPQTDQQTEREKPIDGLTDGQTTRYL